MGKVQSNVIKGEEENNGKERKKEVKGKLIRVKKGNANK